MSLETLLNPSQGNIVFFVWNNMDDWPVEFISHSITGILGYTPDDFISGKIKYADLIHLDDIERVQFEVNQAIQNNLFKKIETAKFPRKNTEEESKEVEQSAA